MKKLIYLLLIFSCSSAIAQKRIVLPTINRKIQTVTLDRNLLDASPGYRRAAIQFVPIAPTPDAVRRGYKADSIYVWVDPNGGRHRARGDEILKQVNDLEKALCERGHTLREKNTFNGLSIIMPRTVKNDLTNCVIRNNLKPVKTGRTIDISGSSARNKIGRTRIDRTRVVKMLENTVYSYTGFLSYSGEFKQGSLGQTSNIERPSNNPAQLSSRLMLVITPKLYDQISKCTYEVADKPNGAALITTAVNIKSPGKTIQPVRGGFTIDYSDDCTEPTNMGNDFVMRVYDITLNNSGNIIPSPTKYPQPYYVTLKFYDASGKLLDTYLPNNIILNNQLPMPINIPVNKELNYAGYDYELTDPTTHSFGFYAKSGGVTTSVASEKIGYDGINRNSSVSADMRIGVKYYNWARLVDGNAPLSKEFDLFAYTIKSEEKYSKPDNGAPQIRVPGNKAKDPDYGSITLLGTTYDLSSQDGNSFQQGISEEIFNQRFFIGPVPCKIAVSLTGNVGVDVAYASNSTTCDIVSSINPYAEVNVHGEGGVDAVIAYAMVKADVNLLKIGIPTSIQVKGPSDLNITETLVVGGLSGQVYFQAGICIPIPFFDDICKDFRIDILKWDGLEKSFSIDPVKGIVLK